MKKVTAIVGTASRKHTYLATRQFLDNLRSLGDVETEIVPLSDYQIDNLIFEPGFSTASDWIRELGFGAGMGLNNIQNCADDMIIDSVVNEGTKLEIIINLVKNVTETAN